jgi:hypothetical protein
MAPARPQQEGMSRERQTVKPILSLGSLGSPGVVSTLGVLAGGLSFGLTGFAFALFATASLALSSSPQVVVPTVLLLADTLALPLLWEHRGRLRSPRLRTVPPFAPWSLPLLLAGIGAGTLLLGRVGPVVGRSALAAVVLAFVAFQCVRPGRGPRPAETGEAGEVGVAATVALAAGILDGWLGTGGPAIVVLLTWKRFAPADFMAAVLTYFLLADLPRAVVYAVAGYWTRGVLALYLRTLPVALAGYAGGVALRRTLVSPPVFRPVVLALLALLGLALLRGAWVEA